MADATVAGMAVTRKTDRGGKCKKGLEAPTSFRNMRVARTFLDRWVCKKTGKRSREACSFYVLRPKRQETFRNKGSPSTRASVAMLSLIFCPLWDRAVEYCIGTVSPS